MMIWQFLLRRLHCSCFRKSVLIWIVVFGCIAPSCRLLACITVAHIPSQAKPSTNDSIAQQLVVAENAWHRYRLESLQKDYDWYVETKDLYRIKNDASTITKSQSWILGTQSVEFLKSTMESDRQDLSENAVHLKGPTIVCVNRDYSFEARGQSTNDTVDWFLTKMEPNIGQIHIPRKGQFDKALLDTWYRNPDSISFRRTRLVSLSDLYFFDLPIEHFVNAIKPAIKSSERYRDENYGSIIQWTFEGKFLSERILKDPVVKQHQRASYTLGNLKSLEQLKIRGYLKLLEDFDHRLLSAELEVLTNTDEFITRHWSENSYEVMSGTLFLKTSNRGQKTNALERKISSEFRRLNASEKQMCVTESYLSGLRLPEPKEFQRTARLKFFVTIISVGAAISALFLILKRLKRRS